MNSLRKLMGRGLSKSRTLTGTRTLNAPALTSKARIAILPGQHQAIRQLHDAGGLDGHVGEVRQVAERAVGVAAGDQELLRWPAVR